MPKVTMTFEEEGDEKVTVVLPAWTVDALQDFVNDPTSGYTSKMELIRDWVIRDLVKPLCQRFGRYPPEALELISTAQTAQAAAQAAIEAALASVINVPPAPEPEPE